MSAHLKVASRSLHRVRRNTDSLHDNTLSVGRRNLNVNAARSETRGVLEEVVLAARRRLPCLAAIGGHGQRGDGNVGVHNLHGEPVGGGTFLVLEDNGGGDAAGNDGVADGDDASGFGAELGEGGLEEVELGGGALGALVDDLVGVS